jgi:hypothetical protein
MNNNSVAPETLSVNWGIALDVEFVTSVKPLTPYQLGALDAEKGEFCLPELYFATRTQKDEYAVGYESVAGRTLLSGQVLSRNERKVYVLSDAELDAELEDLREGIADDDFFRYGC